MRSLMPVTPAFANQPLLQAEHAATHDTRTMNRNIVSP